MEGGRCCGASACTPVARCPHLRRGMGVDAVIWFWASLPPRALRRGGGVSGGGRLLAGEELDLYQLRQEPVWVPQVCRALPGLHCSSAALRCCAVRQHAARLGLYGHLISLSFTSQAMLTCQPPSFQALSFSFSCLDSSKFSLMP